MVKVGGRDISVAEGCNFYNGAGAAVTAAVCLARPDWVNVRISLNSTSAGAFLSDSINL